VEEHGDEPSDDELIRFAAQLLGTGGRRLTDEELLRDTVRDARRLWLLLYDANHGRQPPQPPPS
jgi:hypothetical protein